MHDTVVSFNYDDIADVALWAQGLLKERSFEGLGFTTINLPAQQVPRLTFNLEEFAYVRLLKVHGSINWWNHSRFDGISSSFAHSPLRLASAGGPEVHYYLGWEKLRDDAGNTPDPFILPLHCKAAVYDSVPMFKRHMAAFRYWLQDAREVWLVGKNFQNSDSELNGLIRWATSSRERVLNIIDPACDIPFHLTLFNASLGRRYETLEKFAKASSSSSC